MKKLSAITGLVLAIIFTSFSQVPKQVIVEHFTNTRCSICASRNPGFYNNLNNHTDILHLSIHPSAPYNNCIHYLHNPTENDARTHYYPGVYGGTPRLVIQGEVVPAGANYGSASIFTPHIGQHAPVSIRIEQTKDGSDMIYVKVIVKTEANHSLGFLSLFVALAEDTIFYDAPNGEKEQYHVFRKSLSEPDGTSVSLSQAIGDSVVLQFSSMAHVDWDFSRIYTVAILQETMSKAVVQSAAVSPDLVMGTGIAPVNPVNFEVYPNPFHDKFYVKIAQDVDQMYLTDMYGKILWQYASYRSNETVEISMDGLSKGIYFLRAGGLTKKLIALGLN